MWIPGLKRLRLSAKWLTSRLGVSALILGYHRVAETANDAFGLSVSPAHFAEQLQVLRDVAHPIHLETLVDGLETGHLPRRSVAITLDDGYADALEQAKPLLERYQIPATVFVVAGNLGKEFWWDELERTLMSPSELPPTLELMIGRERFEWQAWQASVSKGRACLINSLHMRFLPLQEADRSKYMKSLRDWGGNQSCEEPIHRAMTSAELVELAGGDLVTIGAHTMTHPILSSLSAKRQKEEIRQSKQWLETVTGLALSGFSYPGGSTSRETQGLVREAGYSYACASENDVARISTDPYCLPRFWVQDWDGSTFSRWLRRWL